MLYAALCCAVPWPNTHTTMGIRIVNVGGRRERGGEERTKYNISVCVCVLLPCKRKKNKSCTVVHFRQSHHGLVMWWWRRRGQLLPNNVFWGPSKIIYETRRFVKSNNNKTMPLV